MTFFRETEKAVKVNAVIDFCNAEKTVTRKIWIPKSQIREGKLTKWIADQKYFEISCMVPRMPGNDYLISFADADGAEIEVAEDEALRRGKENYARLIELAKNAGVKGVRTGLRRATIEAKLAAAGVAF